MILSNNFESLENRPAPTLLHFSKTLRLLTIHSSFLQCANTNRRFPQLLRVHLRFLLVFLPLFVSDSKKKNELFSRPDQIRSSLFPDHELVCQQTLQSFRFILGKLASHSHGNMACFFAYDDRDRIGDLADPYRRPMSCSVLAWKIFCGWRKISVAQAIFTP